MKHSKVSLQVKLSMSNIILISGTYRIQTRRMGWKKMMQFINVTSWMMYLQIVHPTDAGLFNVTLPLELLQFLETLCGLDHILIIKLALVFLALYTLVMDLKIQISLSCCEAFIV